MTSKAENDLRIVRLTAENVKRLKAVEIVPEGDVVLITGRNGAGKSSVLDAIAYALGGARLIPSEPIRHGETRASVTVDLGDLRVTRRWSGERSTLEVTNREGASYKSPQAILDKLCGELTFDPLAFSRMKAAEQRDTLLRLAGLADKLNTLDATRADLYSLRTTANAEASSLRQRIAGIVVPEGTPAEPVSTAEITKLYNDARQRQVAVDAIREAATEAQQVVEFVSNEVQRANARIEELRAKLAEAEKHRDALLVDREAADVKLGEARRAAEAAVDVDFSEVEAAVAKVEQTNKDVARLHERAALETQAAEAARRAESLTEKIVAIDAEKVEAVSSYEWPIPGLGFTPDGVTLNGVPLEQASSSEALRLSVAIGMALNRKARVMLVRDGSLMDSASMEIVRQLASDNAYQVWVEVATDGEPMGIVIEDGQVRST